MTLPWTPRSQSLRDWVSQRLAGLPSWLTYHGAHHTLLEVLPVAETLAEAEGVGADELEILRAAVLFHDFGFLERYEANESLGAQSARSKLLADGWEPSAVDRVERVILATSIADSPNGPIQKPGADILEQVMCDADLDNLGRPDFWVVSDNLRAELAHRGISYDEAGWLRHQIAFLERHRFFTAAARARGERGKREHLILLRRRLKEHLHPVRATGT